MNPLIAPMLVASLPPFTGAVLSASSSSTELDVVGRAGGWQVVVDGVMGGRSTGNVDVDERGVLVFTGDLSLENNGGFSQIRTPVDGVAFAGTEGIELRVRGDGRTYTFDVRTSDARVMAGGFQQEFETSDGTWTSLTLPFDGFRLKSFGRRVGNAPLLDPSRIESIGVTLADKREGAFRLEIDSIAALGAGRPEEPSGTVDWTALGRESTQAKLADLVAAAGAEAAPSVRDETRAARACVRLIERAIERGVPAFNSGQPAACAAMYEIALQSMVTLAADALPADVVEGLEAGLERGAAERDGTSRAWSYRRTLDAAYARLNRMVARR